MKLADALAVLQPELRDAAVIVANGYISRAVHGTEDRAGNFYMIGSMGLASAIGLGVATARPERPVAVLDGDGNVLMNLGELATVATRAPRNFHHIVFDNERYASTGNQPTQSAHIDLAAIAAAAGYPETAHVSDLESFRAAALKHLAAPGPTFLLAKIDVEEGTSFGRVEIEPAEMVRRTRELCLTGPR